ncbi:unnamed protein product, partial [marine sediment metagenome]
MIKPNFSECQLQQLVNIEIVMRIYSLNKNIYIPIIINPLEEHKLGWDTAFYFPWLFLPQHQTHRGCNFFIQYKLSKIIEGHRGKEWICWRKPYLIFQIPYPTKDGNNKHYYDNYNQFDNLKELSNKGYYVYYATNHIVYDYELFSIAKDQRLVEEIPLLDVSMIKNRHKNVTFTRD